MLYPLKLKAAFKDYLWGGTRLRDEFNKQTDINPVAESWELSCHHDGQSIIENGSYAGKTLNDYIETESKSVIGTKAANKKDFPVLIKFIDAKQSLSVQVHPDDNYALLNEGESGKTEMWYVMDAEPNSTLIYGFTKNISHQEFAKRIHDNTLLEVCNQVPIKKATYFYRSRYAPCNRRWRIDCRNSAKLQLYLPSLRLRPYRQRRQTTPAAY